MKKFDKVEEIIEIKPKKIIEQEEYMNLLEYKFRYLELKEIVNKWISLNEKGE